MLQLSVHRLTPVLVTWPEFPQSSKRPFTFGAPCERCSPGRSADVGVRELVRQEGPGGLLEPGEWSWVSQSPMGWDCDPQGVLLC